LFENIQKVAALGKQRMRQSLQQGGDLEMAFHQKIDAIPSLKEMEGFGKRAGDEVLGAALQTWHEVQNKAGTQLAELLAPLAADADALLALQESGNLSPELQVGRGPEVAGHPVGAWFDRFRTGMLYSGVVGSALGISLGGAVFSVAWPLGLVVLGVGGLAYAYGYQSAKKNQVKVARQELAKYLNNVLQHLRQHFFNVDQTAGRFGQVDEFFGVLERAAAEQATLFFDKKMAAVQTEIDRLKEAAQLNDSERRARADEVRRQLGDWEGVGRSITAVQAELQELERAWTSSPVAPG
jgi:hypothetical protein